VPPSFTPVADDLIHRDGINIMILPELITGGVKVGWRLLIGLLFGTAIGIALFGLIFSLKQL